VFTRACTNISQKLAIKFYMLTYIRVKVKVKQSHYKPGQALRVPGGWGSQISRQSAHGGGKVVSPTHRPPLSPGNIPGTHFWVDPKAIVRPEGLCEWKHPMTASGIKPATFRLVAQCLNQLRHCVPPAHVHYHVKTTTIGLSVESVTSQSAVDRTCTT